MPTFREVTVATPPQLEDYVRLLGKAEPGKVYEAILGEEETQRGVRTRLRQAAEFTDKQVRFLSRPEWPRNLVRFQVFMRG